MASSDARPGNWMEIALASQGDGFGEIFFRNVAARLGNQELRVRRQYARDLLKKLACIWNFVDNSKGEGEVNGRSNVLQLQGFLRA